MKAQGILLEHCLEIQTAVLGADRNANDAGETERPGTLGNGESSRPDEMGGTDEQLPSAGRTERIQRIGLRLEEDNTGADIGPPSLEEDGGFAYAPEDDEPEYDTFVLDDDEPVITPVQEIHGIDAIGGH